MEQRRLKLLIDTNVLLDVVCPDNRPSANASACILKAIKDGYLEGELSTLSIMDAAYVASQTEGCMVEKFRCKIVELSTFINIDSMDYFSMMQAVKDCTGDFEDDAQFAFAYNTGCDIVLTGDKGFHARSGGKSPHIRFFTPEAFLAEISS